MNSKVKKLAWHWIKNVNILMNGCIEDNYKVTYGRYRELRAVMKQAVNVVKIMADLRWGKRG